MINSMSSPSTRRSMRSMSCTSTFRLMSTRTRDLPAAECEQLMREIGGALGGFRHLLQVVARRIARDACYPKASASIR